MIYGHNHLVENSSKKNNMAESRAVIEYQTKKSLFDIISKEIFCHLCKIVPREPPIYFSSMVKHTYVNTYLEV